MTLFFARMALIAACIAPFATFAQDASTAPAADAATPQVAPVLTDAQKADAAKKAAEKAAAAKATAETVARVQAAQAALDAAWDESTVIAFGTVALVEKTAEGFGLYVPRDNALYRVGTPIMIYAEPIGYAFGKTDDGQYKFGFDVNLIVQTAAGETLGNVEGILNMGETSRYPNKEFNANLTYNLEGLPPGNYVLTTELKDQNSTRTGSFETAIELVP